MPAVITSSIGSDGGKYLLAAVRKMCYKKGFNFGKSLLELFSNSWSLVLDKVILWKEKPEWMSGESWQKEV